MTPTDPMQGNEIIAEFIKHIDSIGWVNKYPYYPDHLKFHTSWDWLMPVVEKIESLGFSFTIFNEAAIIKRTFNRKFHEAQQMTYLTTSKLESTYGVVLEFINWYNSTPNGTTNE